MRALFKQLFALRVFVGTSIGLLAIFLGGTTAYHLFASSPPVVDFSTGVYLSQTNWDGGVGTNTSSQFTSVTNIVTSTTGEISGTSTPGTWYNGSWTNRRQITISSAQVSTTETNFPVLITGDNFDAAFFSSVRSDGGDIIFTASDGTTELAKELVSITTSTQSLEAWVTIPSLSNSVDTSIYVYYNNPANALTNSTSVWANNFNAVWHFDTAVAPTDSTGNGNTGAANNTPTASSTAAVGAGITFDGTSQYIDVNDANSLDMSGNFSFSFWMSKASATARNERMFNKAGDGGAWQSNYNLQMLNSADGDTEIAIYGDGGGNNYFAGPSATLTGTSWYHVSVDYDGSNVRMYRNGVLVHTGAYSGVPVTSGQPLYIASADGASEYFAGTLDEIRLSATSRNGGWFTTEYNNQSSPSTFYSVGSAETQSFGFTTGTLVSAIFDTGGSAQEWGTVRWTSSNDSFVTVKARSSNDSGMSGATAFASCGALTQDQDITSETCVTDGERYIQYQVELTTTTVTFQDIDIVALGSNTISVSEPSAGTLIITASIDETSGSNVTVPFTVGGTAANPADHDLSAGNITITAGQLTGTTSVTIADDSDTESSETIILTMGVPTNGQAGNQNTYTITILDDEFMPDVSLSSSANQTAEAGGTVDVIATLSTSSASTVTVTLGFSGTATANTDFTSSSAVITVSPGNTTGSITLTGVSDTTVEGDELIIVGITTSTNASISGTPQAAISLIDNMGTLDVTAYHTSIGQTDPSTVSQYEVFEFTLHHPVDYGGQNNYSDVTLTATFTSQFGGTNAVNGFYYDTVSTTFFSTSSLWKVRFASSTVGPWTYTYQLTHTPTGNTAFGSGNFDITTGTRKGFIRTSTLNNQYWNYETGGRHIPIVIQQCEPRLELYDSDGGTRGGAFDDMYSLSEEQYYDMFTRAGVNTLRISPRNCSFALSPFDLNTYFANALQAMDRTIMNAHAREMSIMYGIFGYLNTQSQAIDTVYPSTPPSTAGSPTQPVLDMLTMAVARWAPYVDIWQIMNETDPANPTWLTEVSTDIRAKDPYDHPISTSWGTTTVSGIEIYHPHVYAGGSYESAGRTQLDGQFNVDLGASNGLPLMYSEWGRSTFNWTIGAETKMRVLDWTALHHGIPLMRWNSAFATNGMDSGAIPNYMGRIARQQFRVLSWYADQIAAPDLEIVTSSMSVASTTVLSSAMRGSNGLSVYLEHTLNHTNTVSGQTLSVYSSSTGYGYWIDPFDGQIVATTSVVLGENTFTVPDFIDDIALFTTTTPSPDFFPIGIITFNNPQDDGNLDNDSNTTTWDGVTYAAGADVGDPLPYGEAPFTIGFRATSSTDPDGGTLTYSWDFGDGGATATGVAATHTYSNKGHYFVGLTVTDDEGNTDTQNILVKVLTDSNLDTNDAPVLLELVSSTISIPEGQFFSLAPTAFDRERYTSSTDIYYVGRDVAYAQITYSVTGLPDGATFATSTDSDNHANLEWTPDASQAGTYTLVFTATDGGGLTDTQTVTLIVEDTLQASAIVSTSTLALTEDGGLTNYLVELNTRPTGTVTMTLSPDAQLTLSTTSIVFSSTTWNSPVAVTVSAADDASVEGAHTGTVSHSVAQTGGGEYQGITVPSIQFSITDNDTATTSLVITTSTIALTESGTATYTIALASQPTTTVDVYLATSTEDVSVSPASITFSSTTWNVAQTITMTAVDDQIVEEAETVIISHTVSSTGDYNAIGSENVTTTITDNDTASVTITTSSIAITEGGTTATYTIALGAIPTSSVTVSISADAQATTSLSSVTFSSTTWNVAQTITVTATDDVSVEGAHTAVITHTASQPSGGSFDAVSVSSTTFNVTDNDTSVGITVTSSSPAISEAGVTSSMTVVLDSAPTSSVIITLSTSTDGVTLSSTTLTFTTGNWNVAQSVVVSATDDNLVEGTHTSQVTFTVSNSGGSYDGFSVTALTFTITDNDTAGVTLSTTSLSLAEGGSAGSYTVVLDSQPTSSVVITLATSTTEVTLSATTLTFATTTWNIAQTVTVTPVDDALADGLTTTTITHTVSATDTDYNGLSVAQVTSTVTDNDSPGVTVSLSSLALAEGGSAGTYTIVLNTQPTSTVDITLVTSTPEASISTTSIQFTSTTWNVAQTITVTPADDALADGVGTTTITHTASSTDTAYHGTSIGSVTATVTDNDTASVTVSQTTISFQEGDATSTYTIVLTSQPSSTVTIALATSTTEFTVSTSSLTFTSSDWNVAQTVSVIPPAEDFYAEPTTTSDIVHTATSADLNYNGITINTTTVTSADDDVAGFTFTPSSLSSVTEGNTTAYTVILSSQPSSTVELTLSEPSSEASLSTTTIFFTSTTYNTPITVTITTVDNSTDEADRSVIINHSVTSTDANYHGVNTTTLTFVIADNDAAPSTSSGGGGGGGGYVSYSTTPAVADTTTSTTERIVDTTTTTTSTPTVVVENIEACSLQTGTPYRGSQSSAVYLVTSDCRLRPFQSPATYFTYFDSWSEVQTVPQSFIEAAPRDIVDFVPAGPKYDPQYGALVKVVEDPRVYLLLGNERYWISSEEVFTALNYQWSWIEDVDASLLSKYLPGSEINYTNRHPNFTLVKYDGDPKVYRLEPHPTDSGAQVKRHILNESVFSDFNFRFDRIVTIPATETYLDGEPIGEPAAASVATQEVISTVTEDGILRYGDTGVAVQLLEVELLKRGYDITLTNGVFDLTTLAAVRAFQTDNDITPTGNVGPLTKATLGLE